MTGLEQLARVQEFATERAGREDIYPFMRENAQVFQDVLCTLLGAGAITDEALDDALAHVRRQDDLTAQAIVRKAKMGGQ